MTMQSMMEKMARAICNWQDPDNWDRAGEIPAGSSMGPHREHFRVMARAVLAALEEPTEGMLRAGDLAAGEGGYVVTGPVWRTMIRAAKAGE